MSGCQSGGAEGESQKDEVPSSSYKNKPVTGVSCMAYGIQSRALYQLRMETDETETYAGDLSTRYTVSNLTLYVTIK